MSTLAITEQLGRFEKFFSEAVYPVWPLWLAGAAVMFCLLCVTAYRLGWHRFALRHRLATGAAAAALLAFFIPAGYYTLSPLFESSLACEASPIAGAGAGAKECAERLTAATAAPTAAPGGLATPPPATEAAATFQARVVRQGEFRGADDFHFGRGKALLIETAPGRYVLRFEEFAVRNGPDLFVYLSPETGYSGEAVNLGQLKATEGAFNYEIPPGIGVERFQSVIVWCRAFAVLFATAPLAGA